MEEQTQQKTDQIAQLAETAEKNPIKALYWVLFIAISILGSIVLYMYKQSEAEKNEIIAQGQKERREIYTALDSCKHGRTEDIRRYLQETNEKLEKRIQEQERINNSRRK